MAPTVSDQGLLLHYTGLALIGNLIILTSTSLCYGIFLILTLFYAKIHIARKRLTRSDLGMFLAAGLVFVSTTLYWILLFNVNISLLKIALVDTVDRSLAESLKLANQATSSVIFSNAEIWLQSLNFFLADAILVFRVWVIVSAPHYRRVINIILLIGSGVAACAACIVRMFAPGTDEDETTIVHKAWSNIQLVGWILSLLCNLTGTILIGNRAWKYHRLSSPQHRLRNKEDPSSVGRTLAVLVESGALYVLLQIAFIVLQKAPRSQSLDSTVSGANFAAQSLLSCCVVLSGVLPISTLCIVTLNRSIADCEMTWEDSSISPGVRTALSPVMFSSEPGIQTVEVVEIIPQPAKGKVIIVGDHF